MCRRWNIRGRFCGWGGVGCCMFVWNAAIRFLRDGTGAFWSSREMILVPSVFFLFLSFFFFFLFFLFEHFEDLDRWGVVWFELDV